MAMPVDPARTSPEPDAKLRATVLIVEDEVLIRFALADFLRDNNCKVYEAHDGEEAIQFLSFYKADIDVVFTDVRLPGSITGFALANWIERHRPSTAVMLGSGYPIDLATVAMTDVAVFSKPYDLKQIRQTMDALLQKRRHGA
jgi:DNA-binding NtrC family response regulator